MRSAALVPAVLGAALAAALLAAGPARGADTLAEADKLLANSSDWSERVRGLEMLEGLKGDGRAEKLAVKALKDDDWGVEIRACAALGKIGTDDSVFELANLAVHGEIQWVRDAAADALGQIDAAKGSDALLDRAAKYPRDDELRRRAILGAGRIAPKEDAGRIVAYAKVKEPVVAAAAIRAVSRLLTDPDVRKDTAKTIEGVLSKRGDKKHFFAYAAACEAIAALDDAEARGLALKEIREKPDDDAYIEERIARGFAAQDPAKVAASWTEAVAATKKSPELRRLVRLAGRMRLAPARTDVEKLLGHSDERVRDEAARALGRIGDAASADAVAALLADKSPYARLEAVTALARLLPLGKFLDLGTSLKKDGEALVRLQFVAEVAELRRPEGIDALKPYLGDPDWRVQSAAAATVGTLGVAEDLPLLQPLVGHRDWKIRAAAYEGLGRLRAKDAIPILTDGIPDRDPVVKSTCLANLQILTGEKYGDDLAEWRAWWTKNGQGLNLVKKSRLPDADAVRRAKANEKYAKEYAIEVLQKARILVVQGAWDKVQIVLEHLKIPHTLLRAQQLKDNGLNPNQIVLVNCEGNMDKDTQERVRWFVNVGGSLMTTDWALTKTVQPCFPGYVQQFSGTNTGNDVVVVEEGLKDHPLTQGIFDNVPALQWWLEIQAFPITVTWPERCEVLVDSAEMRQRYGSSPMAVTFRWGLGRVQHSLSHFYLQEEGMQKAAAPRDRMIFAADNLGLSLEQIRRLRKEGAFDGQINQEAMKQIAPDYSMFRLIVNVVREKSDWVENL